MATPLNRFDSARRTVPVRRGPRPKTTQPTREQPGPHSWGSQACVLEGKLTPDYVQRHYGVEVDELGRIVGSATVAREPATGSRGQVEVQPPAPGLTGRAPARAGAAQLPPQTTPDQRSRRVGSQAVVDPKDQGQLESP
jgi:hypothetical protein